MTPILKSCFGRTADTRDGRMAIYWIAGISAWVLIGRALGYG